MRTLILACSLIAVAVCGPVPGAALEVENLLPADTGFVLVIEDVPTYLEQWEASPWARLWDDPGFSPLTVLLKDPETGKAKWNAYEPTLADVLDAIEGQAAVVVPDLARIMNEKDSGDKPWALIGVLSIPGSGIQEIIDREEGEISEREVQGIKIHYRMKEHEGVSTETLSWAQVGEVGILGMPSEYVGDLVQRIKGKVPDSPLSGTPEFRTMKRRNPGAGVYCYVNLAGFLAFVQEGMEAGMSENPKAAALGVSGSGLFEVLGLDSFRVFYASFKQLDREAAFDFGLHYTPNGGITALMANLSGPCPRPGFITDKAVMASSSRYSFSQAWDALLDILDAVNPGVSGMLQTQLQQATISMGVDLETDVIRNLGEDSFSAYFPVNDSAMDADQVFGISVKDPARLEKAIQAVLTAMGPEAETVGSHKVGKALVYDMTGPGTEMGKAFSLSLYKGQLLVGIGSPDALTPVIRGMEKPGPSIWNRTDLKPLFDRLPPEAYTVGYYDTGKFMQSAIGYQLDRLEKTEPGKPGMDAMSEVDWERLSRYFGAMVTATVKTGQGMFGTGYIILREP